jgi:hypothetical protein
MCYKKPPGGRTGKAVARPRGWRACPGLSVRRPSEWSATQDCSRGMSYKLTTNLVRISKSSLWSLLKLTVHPGSNDIQVPAWAVPGRPRFAMVTPSATTNVSSPSLWVVNVGGAFFAKALLQSFLLRRFADGPHVVDRVYFRRCPAIPLNGYTVRCCSNHHPGEAPRSHPVPLYQSVGFLTRQCNLPAPLRIACSIASALVSNGPVIGPLNSSPTSGAPVQYQPRGRLSTFPKNTANLPWTSAICPTRAHNICTEFI